MEKKLTPELKALKDEFDFTHKKIGELEWKRATLFLGRKAVMKNEIELLEEQLELYGANMGIVIEKIKKEVTKVNGWRVNLC